MANKKFKVKYATRNKLARSLQKEIRALGLIDEGTLYDSIKISAVSGEVINELMITINAMYYYLFLDEGTKRTHPDFGTSVVFKVEHEKEQKNFYVRETNYAFLGQIKDLGILTGRAAKVSRVGSKKSDTRYSIALIEQ